jgi:hypothetical protein
MADISQVKLPNGDTYNLVDETSGYITLPDLPVYDGTVVEDGDGYVVDKGFECTATYTTLTEETVTTVADKSPGAQLTYSQVIDADTIRVTFNGVEYVCNKHEIDVGTVEPMYAYGGVSSSGPDFSEYPFDITSARTPSGAINGCDTQTAGTYTVKIEVPELVVTTTPCFEKAVKSVVDGALIVKYDHDGDDDLQYYDKTWQQVKDAFDAGLPIYLHLDRISSATRQYFTSLNSMSGSLSAVFHDFNGGNTQLLAEDVNGFLYKSELE